MAAMVSIVATVAASCSRGPSRIDHVAVPSFRNVRVLLPVHAPLIGAVAAVGRPDPSTGGIDAHLYRLLHKHAPSPDVPNTSDSAGNPAGQLG